MILRSAIEQWDEVARMIAGRRVAVFLDYDGTLTPIVARPELAVLAPEMRAVLRDLASLTSVAIVSGRDRLDVEDLVRLDELVFAGSHGFDIAGPKGLELEHECGAAAEPVLEAAHAALRETVGTVDGILIERKRFAIAVHYRNVGGGDSDQSEIDRIDSAVDRVAARYSDELRRTHGKKVFELRPRIDWDKGRAVLWLLDVLDLGTPDVLPIYIGDDLTDEDAFRAVAGRGLGILVGDFAPESNTRDVPEESAASFGLSDTREVGEFLRRLSRILELDGRGAANGAE